MACHSRTLNIPTLNHSSTRILTRTKCSHTWTNNAGARDPLPSLTNRKVTRPGATPSPHHSLPLHRCLRSSLRSPFRTCLPRHRNRNRKRILCKAHRSPNSICSRRRPRPNCNCPRNLKSTRGPSPN